MKNYLFGGISGFCEVCVSHPIDYYKTKLQENSNNNRNLKSILTKNIRNNGILSVYKGFIPKVIGTVPTRFIFWGTQNNINNICDQKNIISHKKYLLSGICSGSAQTILDNPVEVIKIQMMTGSKSINSIPFMSYYRGLSFTLPRNIIFATAVCYGNGYSKNSNTLINFISTGITAFTACIITQPLDFFKTKKQEYNFKKIQYLEYFNKHNYKKMFIGTYARASIGFINMGIGCVVFNTLIELFK